MPHVQEHFTSLASSGTASLQYANLEAVPEVDYRPCTDANTDDDSAVAPIAIPFAQISLFKRNPRLLPYPPPAGSLSFNYYSNGKGVCRVAPRARPLSVHEWLPGWVGGLGKWYSCLEAADFVSHMPLDWPVILHFACCSSHDLWKRRCDGSARYRLLGCESAPEIFRATHAAEDSPGGEGSEDDDGDGGAEEEDAGAAAEADVAARRAVATLFQERVALCDPAEAQQRIAEGLCCRIELSPHLFAQSFAGNSSRAVTAAATASPAVGSSSSSASDDAQTLERLSLGHLASLLLSAQTSLRSLALLQSLAGRPRCLALLKSLGVTKLAERQALVNAIARERLSAGRLAEALHSAIMPTPADPVAAALHCAARDGALTLSLLDACQQGHTLVIELLCRANADVEQCRRGGRSALSLAACGGHAAAVSLLLQHKADVDRAGSADGWTALMWASYHGQEECVAALLHGGARVNATKRSNGFSALRAATIGRHAHCVDLLVQSRADAVHRAITDHDIGISDGDAAADGVLPIGLPSDLDRTENWMERPVAAMAHQRCYRVSSHTLTYANLLQVILRANGFDRDGGGVGLGSRDEARREDGGADAENGWTLCWLAGSLSHEAAKTIRAGQVVSKFPGKCALASKVELSRCCRGLPFLPETYVMPGEVSDFERALLAKLGGSGESGGGEEAAACWIFKPLGAARGCGIQVRGPPATARAVLEMARGYCGVVSRYLQEPFLVGHRKADLRLYVLVTSWEPLHAYLHAQGLCRLASLPYATGEWGNARSHLTNSAINQPSAASPVGPPDVGDDDGDDDGDDVGARPYTLSLTEFHRHLVTSIGESAADQTWREIEALVLRTLQSAPPQQQPPNGGTCFELLGFDVLCDARGTPHLLEVNQDPSLATDTDVDLTVKAAMLTDLLRLVLARDECTDGQGRHAGGWRKLAE